MTTAHTEESTALARRPTPAEAPVRISSSFDTCEPGELVMIDGQGQPLGPWARRRMVMAHLGLRLLTVLTFATAVGLFAGPFAAFAAGIGVELVMARYSRTWQQLLRALSLASAGRREEAYATVRELDRRRLSAQVRICVEQLAGKLEWQYGRLPAALARFDRALQLLKRRRRDATYWLCVFDRVQLLAVMHRFSESEAAQLELQAAPSGEFFARERIMTELVLAFHRDDPDRLPDDDTLHEWARTGLRASRFGTSLVMLAWAFARRGDREMADHLLAEAPSRLVGEFLAESMPRVYAWMLAHRPRKAEAYE